MTDTQKRLNKIATDINNYFDNDMFEGYQVKVVGFVLVFSHTLRFLVDINGGKKMVAVSSDRTDQEIKNKVSNTVFRLLDKLIKLQETRVVTSPMGGGFFAFLAGLSSVPSEYWPTFGYLDNIINRGNNDNPIRP